MVFAEDHWRCNLFDNYKDLHRLNQSDFGSNHLLKAIENLGMIFGFGIESMTEMFEQVQQIDLAKMSEYQLE